MSSFNQSQWPSWAYEEVHDPSTTSYSQYPTYTSYLADSMDAYQTNHHHLVHHQQMSRTTESKPRLSKEEVEILEAEFQKNHKPNSTIKKALAESMRVDNARINVCLSFFSWYAQIANHLLYRTGSRTAVRGRRKRETSESMRRDRNSRTTRAAPSLPTALSMSASVIWLLQVRPSPLCIMAYRVL